MQDAELWHSVTRPAWAPYGVGTNSGFSSTSMYSDTRAKAPFRRTYGTGRLTLCADPHTDTRTVSPNGGS